MKLCKTCNTNQPDNFMVCSKCGADLSAQTPQGVPMRLFMYDRSQSKKMGTMSLGKIFALVFIGTIIFVLIWAASIIVIVQKGMEFTFGIAMLLSFAVTGSSIALALALKSKRARTYIAYMYYDGILYKMIMQPGYSGFYPTSTTGGAMSIAYNINQAYEMERKSAYAGTFLFHFYNYLCGEYVWDKMRGGPMYIQPLLGFRVTADGGNYYRYTFFDQKNRPKSGKMDKVYPGIEMIFGSCR